MPKKLERKLEREASAKGYTGRRRSAYVYGTLTKVKKEQAAKRKRSKKRSR